MYFDICSSLNLHIGDTFPGPPSARTGTTNVPSATTTWCPYEHSCWSARLSRARWALSTESLSSFYRRLISRMLAQRWPSVMLPSVPRVTPLKVPQAVNVTKTTWLMAGWVSAELTSLGSIQRTGNGQMWLWTLMMAGNISLWWTRKSNLKVHCDKTTESLTEGI